MASWAILVSASEIKEESMLIISVVVLPTGGNRLYSHYLLSILFSNWS